MSIGRKDTLYTLVDETTGNSYSFKYGKMHITGGVIYIDEYGDDVAQWFYDNYINNVPQSRSRTFKFNGLVGLKLDFEGTLNSDGVSAYWGATLYIEGHKGDRDGNYSMYMNGDFDGKKNTFVYPNATQGKLGLMFCYMDNAPYEGISIYPAHFVHRYDGGYFYKVPYANIGNAPYYQPTSNTVAAQIDAGQYIGSVWASSYNRFPANYLMRDYHNLGFSDSGNINKQQATIVQGFPFGSDDEGESKDVGGQGEMKDTSTPIEIDDPRILFVGNLFRVYKLNTTALSALSNYLLSSEFLDNVVKLFNDPMDYLISLTAIPTAAFSGNAENIKIGNVETNIGATRLSNFFVDIDCGSVNIPLYFDAFLDCAPYTSISLYLVGVGTVDLNVDMFLGQSVKLKYRVDALTGQCLVFVSNNDGLVATYSGNIAYHIPLRSKDYSEFFSGVMSTATAAMTGNALGVGAGALQLAQGVTKPRIVQGGSFGGNTSIMLNKKCYLIIERPSISIPKTYPNTIGYMSRISAQLSTLKGFTQVEAIHLDHVTATDEEKAELEALLKTGVIL